MDIASLTSTPMRKAMLRFRYFIRQRRVPLALAAAILVVNCSMALSYSVLDRSLNYVPVNAVTRAIVHECSASRRVRDGKDGWHYEYLDGHWSCEQLRALVQKDGYGGYSINDSVYVSLVYRSPVDNALYVGRLPLALYLDPAQVPLEAGVTILASKRSPGEIAACCHTRVDWFDKPTNL